MSGMKKRKSSYAPVQIIAEGVLICLLVLIGAILVSSLLVSESKLPLDMMKLAAYVLLFGSVTIGSIVSNKINKKSKMVIGVAIGIIIFIAIAITGSFISDCLPVNSNTPVLLAVCLSAGVFGNVLTMKKRKSRR